MVRLTRLLKILITSLTIICAITNNSHAGGKTDADKACDSFISFTRKPEVINSVCSWAGLISARFEAQQGKSDEFLSITCRMDRDICQRDAAKRSIRCDAKRVADFKNALSTCPAAKSRSLLITCLKDTERQMKSSSSPLRCSEAARLAKSSTSIDLPIDTERSCKQLAATCPKLFDQVRN